MIVLTKKGGKMYYMSTLSERVEYFAYIAKECLASSVHRVFNVLEKPLRILVPATISIVFLILSQEVNNIFLECLYSYVAIASAMIALLITCSGRSEESID